MCAAQSSLCPLSERGDGHGRNEIGRPVGEPSTLALSRLRREGIPALCRRPWPFERGLNGHSKRTPVPRNVLLKNSTTQKQVDWVSTLLTAIAVYLSET